MLARPKYLKRDPIYAQVTKILVINRRNKEVLIADLVKIIRQEMAFFQELAIRRTAVSLVRNAGVEMRIDIYSDPFLGAEHFGHRDTIRVRDVIPTAENDEPLPLRKDLFDDGRVGLVGFFKRGADNDIAQVEQLFLDIERG